MAMLEQHHGWGVSMRRPDGDFLLGKYGPKGLGGAIPKHMNGYKSSCWATRQEVREFIKGNRIRAERAGHEWLMTYWKQARAVRLEVTVKCDDGLKWG